MGQLKTFVLLAISLLLESLIFAQPVPTITLQAVQGTPYNYPNGIDYHEPSGSLLLSENYPNGEPYNFDRILFDGTHVQFSNVAGIQSEVYFATVRSSYTASLAQGFQIGDLYTGTNQEGQLLRIQSDPTGQNTVVTNPWTTVPSPPDGNSIGQFWGFCFDYTGVWNGDLLVVGTNGPMYRVNALGQAVFIGDPSTIANGVEFEGIGLIPNDTSRYGPYAGSILTFDDTGTYVYILLPSLQFTTWNVGRSNLEWENLLYIFPYSNFWVVDSQRGALLASSWQDWQSVAGEVMIYEEQPLQGTTGLYLVRYNSSTQSLYLAEILLTSSSLTPLLLEGASFSAAGVNNIAPAVNVCFVGFWNGQVNYIKPFVLPAGQTLPVAFYGYNTVAQWSPDPHTSTPNVPRPQSEHIVFYWSLTQYNTLFLTILADAPLDGTPGSLQLEVSSVNLDNSGVTLIQLDDSPQFTAIPADYPDNYYWYPSTGNAVFQWKWGNETSDGVIMGPFPLYQSTYLNQGYCLKPRVLSSNGINLTTPMYLATVTNNGGIQNTTYLPLGPDPEFCVYLCPQYCFIYGTCSDCNANSPQCVWCSATQTCQNVGQGNCPGNQTTTTCPCDTYGTCSSCTSQPQCAWCCDNYIGSCVDAGSNQCAGTIYANSTSCNLISQCNPQCANGGQCVCSQCQCPTGFYGADCSETKDCLGVINGTATYDICGVCDGNGTECLGCDGKPYGVNFYDACGVCGGNGLECYHPCNATNCSSCLINSEICSWCPVEQKCIYLLRNETCQYSNESRTGVKACPSFVLTPAAIVGLSAGVIAAIVIAVVVVLAVAAGVGGRMIYVHYRKTDAPQDIVQNNPTYETKTVASENPLYGSSNIPPP